MKFKNKFISSAFIFGALLSTLAQSKAVNIYSIDAAEDRQQYVSADHPNITRIYISRDTTEESIIGELQTASRVIQANEGTITHISVAAHRTYTELIPFFRNVSRVRGVTTFSVELSDLYNSSFGEQVGPTQPIWEAFIEALTNLKELKHLTITWETKDFPNDMAYKLAEALRGKSLESFTSRGLVNINDLFLDLTPTLSRMPTLREIDFIQAHDINDEGAATLAGILARLPKLEKFFLAHNRISDKGLDSIAGALQDKPFLRAVSVACTDITPAATQSLLKIALRNPSMRVLNTRGTKHTGIREDMDAEWVSGVDEFVRTMEEHGYVVDCKWRVGAFFFAPKAEATGDWVSKLSQKHLMRD